MARRLWFAFHSVSLSYIDGNKMWTLRKIIPFLLFVFFFFGRKINVTMILSRGVFFIGVFFLFNFLENDKIQLFRSKNLNSVPVCHGWEDIQKLCCEVGGVADMPLSASAPCAALLRRRHFGFSLCWKCDKPTRVSCQLWVWTCVESFLWLSCIWPSGLLWHLGRIEEVVPSSPWVLVEPWVPAETVEQPRFLCSGLDVTPRAPCGNRESPSVNRVWSRAALVNQTGCPFTTLHTEIDFWGMGF